METWWRRSLVGRVEAAAAIIMRLPNMSSALGNVFHVIHIVVVSTPTRHRCYSLIGNVWYHLLVLKTVRCLIRQGRKNPAVSRLSLSNINNNICIEVGNRCSHFFDWLFLRELN
jgi:hypothetical protein